MRTLGSADIIYIIMAVRWTLLLSLVAFLGGALGINGARLAGGCTSGHGICGMASLSPGSLLMVCTFLGTAIATALTLAALGV